MELEPHVGIVGNDIIGQSDLQGPHILLKRHDGEVFPLGSSLIAGNGLLRHTDDKIVAGAGEHVVASKGNGRTVIEPHFGQV